jgi:hypothetical protein
MRGVRVGPQSWADAMSRMPMIPEATRSLRWIGRYIREATR